jgi:hypothetical protein
MNKTANDKTKQVYMTTANRTCDGEQSMKHFKTYNTVISEQLKDFCDEKTRADVFNCIFLPNVWRIQIIVNESIRRAIYEQTTRN